MLVQCLTLWVVLGAWWFGVQQTRIERDDSSFLGTDDKCYYFSPSFIWIRLPDPVPGSIPYVLQYLKTYVDD